MAKSSVLTVRVSVEVKEQLEALADSTKRSKSFLAAQAIASYVQQEAWQIAEIERAVEEANAGDFASEAEVDAVISRWS